MPDLSLTSFFPVQSQTSTILYNLFIYYLFLLSIGGACGRGAFLGFTVVSEMFITWPGTESAFDKYLLNM